jgi:hypothetical protein
MRMKSSIVGQTYEGDTLAQGSEEGYGIPQLGEKHCEENEPTNVENI